jgi:hypothetical protein
VNATVDAGPAPGSLADRMRARREALEKNTTTTWDLPGFDGILAVEYRALGYQALRKITKRHEQQPDEGLLELYVACDTLIGATIEVYEISETTGKLAATGERWLELARRAGVDLPENSTQRQALLALVPDAAIVSLYNRYTGWIARSGTEADEAVVRDFERTA